MSLLLTAALAVVFTDLTHLTGLSSEEAIFLQLGQADLSLEGLLLAGMVIGALGVLDDVTISQASTVLALRRANPRFGFRELFSRALESGTRPRERHVNTLVLAYVGASLPILLLFSATELGVADAVNLEMVAKEIVATLVGLDRADRRGAHHDRAGGAARAQRPEAAGSAGCAGLLADPEASEPLDAAVAVAVAGGRDDHVLPPAAQGDRCRERPRPAAPEAKVWPPLRETRRL